MYDLYILLRTVVTRFLQLELDYSKAPVAPGIGFIKLLVLSHQLKNYNVFYKRAQKNEGKDSYIKYSQSLCFSLIFYMLQCFSDVRYTGCKYTRLPFQMYTQVQFYSQTIGSPFGLIYLQGSLAFHQFRKTCIFCTLIVKSIRISVFDLTQRRFFELELGTCTVSRRGNYPYILSLQPGYISNSDTLATIHESDVQKFLNNMELVIEFCPQKGHLSVSGYAAANTYRHDPATLQGLRLFFSMF